jgi:hypothetical protein
MQYIAPGVIPEIVRKLPGKGTITTWSVSAKQVTPFIFDPTLKNEGVGQSSAGALVPVGVKADG